MTELTQINPIEVFKEDFGKKLAEFKKRFNVVYDMEDRTQNAAARSDRLEVAGVIKQLDERRKAIKAPLKEQVDLIDKTGRDIKTELEAIRLPIWNQVKEWDDAQQAKIDAEAERVQDLIDMFAYQCLLPMPDPDSARIQEAIDEVHEILIDETYSPRIEEAQLLQNETFILLRELLKKTKKAEADAKELAELRQKQIDQDARELNAEREAIAQRNHNAIREAAIKEAEADAQKKIDDAQAAQKRAEEATERVAAEERAKMQREQEAKERQAWSEQAKAEKKAEGKRHRAKVQKEAMESLNAFITKAECESIIYAIDNGEIPHVRLEY